MRLNKNLKLCPIFVDHYILLNPLYKVEENSFFQLSYKQKPRLPNRSVE